MTRFFRLVAIVAFAVAALAWSGSALAAFAPRIFVSSTGAAGGPAAVTLDIRGNQADDPTAKLQVFVPLGYTATLNQPAGTELGKATATAVAKSLGGASVPLEGTVVAANPADFTGPPNNRCVPGAHQAVWLLQLTAAGNTLRVPVYVDPAAGAATAFASYTIQACLPTPDVPEAQGGAPLGAKVIGAKVDFASTVFSNPTATTPARWRGLFTPYTPGTATPNAPGTLEIQSVVAPAAVTIAGKLQVKRKTTKVPVKRRINGKLRTVIQTRVTTTKFVLLTGSVKSGGTGVADAAVEITGGITPTATTKLVSTTTNASGAFRSLVQVNSKARAVYFSAAATAPERDLGSAGCQATFTTPPAQFTCADATVAAIDVATAKPLRVATV